METLLYNNENNKNINEKIKIRDGDKLKFPDFDDIKVSTKTFVVCADAIFNIPEIFENLPITKYIVVPKKRGRKKKNEPKDPNRNIESGSIITLEYKNRLRGVDLKKDQKEKKKKKGKKNMNYFRNCMTTVIIIDGKKINFKLSRNGKFQMTGCKSVTQSEKCIKIFWGYIKNYPHLYELKNNSDELNILFVPAMRNIDFPLNFCVDREKLDNFFNMNTKYYSLLETSFGYTGVNIKLPVRKSILDINIRKITYNNGEWKEHIYVPYSEYLDMLPEKEAKKKLQKKNYNTFLIFHSGKCILSGLIGSFMKEAYYEFIEIIRDAYEFIEERLDL